jgi:hypothetical protein
MDPEANSNPTIGGAFPNAIPPMGGDGTSLLANKGGAILFDLDGLSSRPLDKSSTAATSRSLPLLSLPTSLSSSAYGRNLPRDITAMLHVSPQSTGSAFGYIYLTVDECIHQDPSLPSLKMRDGQFTFFHAQILSCSFGATFSAHATSSSLATSLHT